MGASIGGVLLTFASTAAFALPQPFGALAGGALSVINMLFGEQNGQEEAAIRQALASALQEFQTQEFTAEIKTETNTLKTAANWLSTNSNTLTDLGDTEASAFAQNVLSQVGSIDSPCSGVADALNNLNDPSLLNDPKLGPQAYQSLLFGVGLYLTYLRLAVQMQCWLALNKSASSNSADLMYGRFDNFRQYTNQWVTTVAGIIDGYENVRLGQVGAVESIVTESLPFSYGQQPKALAWVYNFKDAGPRPPAAGNPPVKDYAGHNFGPASDITSSLEYEGQSNTERNGYVGQVQAVLDTTTYGSDKTGVATWLDNLQTWEQSLTPRTPQEAPALTAAPWGAATPQGTNWVTGATVEYAVVYANSKGESPMGPWSEQIAITSQAFPTLTIPTDPLCLASARHIHRQFSNGTAGVFIIPDNTTTTWQDTNP